MEYNEPQLSDAFKPPRKRALAKSVSFSPPSDSETSSSGDESDSTDEYPVELVEDPRGQVPEDWRQDVLQWLREHPSPPHHCYNVYTNSWFSRE